MDSQLIILVVAGTVGLMLMAFSLIFFVSLYKRKVLENKLSVEKIKTAHQQEMLSATLTSQEQERNRLGTELHDSVGAMLSSIKLNLQVSKRANSVETLDDILEYLDETITQVRSISHEMMPIVFKKYGLQKAVVDLFERIGDVDARVIDWSDVSLSDEQQLMLFRIIQELTNNTLKHAKATAITLSGKREQGFLRIVYSDNGVGFPKEVIEKAEGMGLWNILNRAQTIGAQVNFANGEEGGARLTQQIY